MDITIKKITNKDEPIRLKSDNIELGSILPLPNGRKAVVVEEVENIGKNKRI